MSDVMLHGVIEMPYDMAMSNEMSRRQFYRRAQQALRERNEALAEIAALKSDIEGYVQSNADLVAENERRRAASQCGCGDFTTPTHPGTCWNCVADKNAEIEALRADAARYRWLRDTGDATWRPFGVREGYSGAQADAAIDAAMERGK